MMPDHAPLHPDAIRFLELLNRPGAPAFHTLPAAQQRAASEKLMFAFRPEIPDGVDRRETVLDRPAGDGGPLALHLYRPSRTDPATPLPALLWLHGGGWTVGNLASYDVLCRQLSLAADCAVVAAEYRLAPEHPFPAAPDDACAALHWVIGHAGEYALDANRLAIGGDSAGGNLAIVAALDARDQGLDHLKQMLLVYPSTDQRGITPSHRRFGEGYLLTQDTIRGFQAGYLPRREDYADWRASPLLAPVLAGLPPALLIVASHDPLVDDVSEFAARLIDEGVPVDWALYPGTIHGFFGLGKAFRSAGEALARAAGALRQAFAGG